MHKVRLSRASLLLSAVVLPPLLADAMMLGGARRHRRAGRILQHASTGLLPSNLEL
jgi:hypothetical protein